MVRPDVNVANIVHYRRKAEVSIWAVLATWCLIYVTYLLCFIIGSNYINIVFTTTLISDVKAI